MKDLQKFKSITIFKIWARRRRELPFRAWMDSRFLILMRSITLIPDMERWNMRKSWRCRPTTFSCSDRLLTISYFTTPHQPWATDLRRNNWSTAMNCCTKFSAATPSWSAPCVKQTTFSTPNRTIGTSYGAAVLVNHIYTRAWTNIKKSITSLRVTRSPERTVFASTSAN